LSFEIRTFRNGQPDYDDDRNKRNVYALCEFCSTLQKKHSCNQSYFSVICVLFCCKRNSCNQRNFSVIFVFLSTLQQTQSCNQRFFSVNYVFFVLQKKQNCSKTQCLGYFFMLQYKQSCNQRLHLNV
jgi:hypothetical protein